MGLAAILQLILGAAEDIIPLFIHNPKTQQIEAVIATTATNAVTAIAAANAASAATKTTTTN